MTHFSADAIARARYRVVHETRYAYQSVVTLSQQYLHMTPRSFQYQRIESHEIWVTPIENDGVDGIDYFGNKTRQMTITAPHQKLLVHAESTVVLMQRPGLASIKGTPSWESLRDRLQQDTDPSMLDAYRYLYASPHVICSLDLEQYARISYTRGRPQLDAALDLTQRIFDEFEFDDTATDISTPLEEVLKGRRGVCQDFAQLMIGCLRSLGLPARYVSGYILTHPPAGQPRLIGADASHAWVSVFCPGLGWVDFDPTNRCLVQHDHITLGWGRDFSDVTPMRGVVLGGGEQDLEVRVTVTPLPLGGMQPQGRGAFAASTG
ncbi:transglutaminase family protein [Polaromonas sp.]|uniref:transglutaminase family protein n=1 Tax=Polaromonas sp. TaxID=1869339 RepID=UPI001A2C2FF0|nr:transglutaminase family protein [Burkholderiales bacterium]